MFYHTERVRERQRDRQRVTQRVCISHYLSYFPVLAITVYIN